MALINRPMYEHFGARHLGVKGPGAMTTLEEGVMGVLPLDMSADPAYYYIQGIRMFMGFKHVSAGGAGTYAKIGLSIESASAEIITRIIGIWVYDPVSASDISMYRCARSAFSSDPGVNGHSTDTRVAELQDSQSIIISNAAAAVPGTQLGAFITGPDLDSFGVSQVLPIINPLQAIYFRRETADAGLRMTFAWVEIPAYKAEL